MGLFDSFRKEEVVGTKVLVCALDGRFDALVNTDSQVYKRSYPATSTTIVAGVPGLTQALATSYDVVHLFCDITLEGKISDNSGKSMTGSQLVQSCCDVNVKLLWMASDNRPDGYTKGFDAQGKKINLVMTIRRLGPYFPLFLGNLLEKVSAGEALGKAWNDLNPQGGDSVQPDTPECIFVGGRKIVLRK